MLRKARTSDVRIIQEMLNHYASQGKLLPRSLSELYTHLRDTFVWVDQETGQIVGCCSLHIVWEDLAEVRSLAVREDQQKRGIGRLLVEACLQEAEQLEIRRVFVLTYEIAFFEHMGFSQVDKNIFPQKIWADCLRCPKFPKCDETALLLELKPRRDPANSYAH
jgi:amino-acid N-acetyltransferase